MKKWVFVLMLVLLCSSVLAEQGYRTSAANVPECQSACPLVDACSRGRLSESFGEDNPDYTDRGSCEHLESGSGAWLSCMDECNAKRNKNNAACKSCLANAVPVPSSVAAEVQIDSDYAYNVDLNKILGILIGQSRTDFLAAEKVIGAKCDVARKEIEDQYNQCGDKCGKDDEDRDSGWRQDCFNPCREEVYREKKRLWKPVFTDYQELSIVYNEKILDKTLPSSLVQKAIKEHDTLYRDLYACIDASPPRLVNLARLFRFDCENGDDVIESVDCVSDHEDALLEFAEKYEKLQKEPYCSQDPDCVSKVVEETPKTIPKQVETQDLDKGDYDINIGSTGKVKGKVEIQQTDGSWKQMIEGEAIKAGDLIRTRSDGSTKLNFGDSDVTLGPNTAFRVEELDSNKKIFTLSAGKIWAYVQKVTGKIFTVKTPGTAMAIRGTEFIINYDDGVSTLYLKDGEIDVTSNNGDVKKVLAGQTATISGDGIIALVSLSEEDWQSAIGGLEVDSDLGKTLLIFGVLFLITIAILTGITFIIKKKSGKKTKAWGIGSLVLGILSILLFLVSFLGLALSVFAIYYSKVQNKIQPTGLAKAGLILGIIGIVLNTFFLIIALFAV